MAIEWTRCRQSTALYAFGKEVVTSGGPLPEGTITLHINFRSGGADGRAGYSGRTYVYIVPDGIYEAMKNAPSKGRYYVFVVKARWDYVRKY